VDNYFWGNYFATLEIFKKKKKLW